ncbi:MAG TPA: hemerythrin domain-containing protein [Bacteroidales bacterium]|nr:hemerythrin domain-containing protein [Bacteroidales bacterium]
MHINKDMKMVDVVYLNHHLIHIIHRFGIQLGFGEKTAAELCADYGIDLPFFLEVLNTYHDSSYFPVHHLQQFSAGQLISYLKRTHQDYLEHRIPEIEELLNSLMERPDLEASSRNLLRDFFQQYKHELTHHIHNEETIVYPYVLALERFTKSGNNQDLDYLLSLRYSIKKYEEGHDDVEEKLYDLKNIIIKYIPKPNDSRLLNRILHELFELEADLNNHAHMEDLILVPIVEQMESKLAEKIPANRRL